MLTKCDLLSAKEVAQSIQAIDDDLLAKFPTLSKIDPLPNTSKANDLGMHVCMSIKELKSPFSCSFYCTVLDSRILILLNSFPSNPQSLT